MIGAACNAELPAEIPVPDYDLLECADCGLVFASPMKAAPVAMYTWLSGLEHRKAGIRWEWRRLKRLMRASPPGTTLLDIGCGSGTLLRFLADLPNVQGIGVDHSPAAVDAACRIGIDARVANFDRIEDALDPGRRYDAIVLSHVLEHVEAPRAAMLHARALLSASGAIYVALPYSPMSREADGFDVMNLPPHHLTRWNLRALVRLAERIDMRLDYILAPPKSPFRRALQRLGARVKGGGTKVSKGRALSMALIRPRQFSRLYRECAARERIDGRRAPDAILLIFRN